VFFQPDPIAAVLSVVTGGSGSGVTANGAVDVLPTLSKAVTRLKAFEYVAVPAQEYVCAYGASLSSTSVVGVNPLVSPGKVILSSPVPPSLAVAETVTLPPAPPGR
jgi:hypothetical protein